MKYKVFYVFVIAALLVATPLHAEELTAPKTGGFLTTPFKLFLKKIEEKKEHKEINKNVRNELIEKYKYGTVATSTTNMTLELVETTLKLKDIADRIDSRIKKTEVQGNLLGARTLVKEARAYITEAEEYTLLFKKSTHSGEAQFFYNESTQSLQEARLRLEHATTLISHVTGEEI